MNSTIDQELRRIDAEMLDTIGCIGGNIGKGMDRVKEAINGQPGLTDSAVDLLMAGRAKLEQVRQNIDTLIYLADLSSNPRNDILFRQFVIGR